MLLAIDTATDRASVVLGTPGTVHARRTIVGARRHAAELLPAIEACLQEAGVPMSAITGIVLADGPGSFTGVRVGATVAKAFAHAQPLVFWVAPSLLACAAAPPLAEGEVVLAASDALRGEVFAAAYRCHRDRIETVLGPVVDRPEMLQARLPHLARVVGPAAPKFGAEPTWPDAADLLALVGRPGGAILVNDATSWEPEYGRPAEAQAKWERAHGRPLGHPTGPGR